MALAARCHTSAISASRGRCATPVHIAPVAVRQVKTARRSVAAASFGKDAIDSWIDVAKLVAGSGSSKGPYDELAGAIGRDVYVDLAGWHLYLRDMTAAPGVKMHTALAQQFGPQANKGLRESDVEAVLKKIPVKLGAGKLKLCSAPQVILYHHFVALGSEVSLYDVVPSACVGDLTKILEDFGRRR